VRLFETLILTTILVVLLGFLLPGSKRPYWLRYLPGAAVALICIHLVVEGYRWQMLLAFGLAAVLFLLTAPTWKRQASARAESLSGRRRAVGIAGAVLGLLLLVPAAAVPVLLPVFELPMPGGPYAVGTATFSLTDENRLETITEDPDDCRELLVKAWYPAEPEPGAEVAPYDESAETVCPMLSELIGMPSFWLDHIQLVRSNAYKDAPIARAQRYYPVLIFSHGYLAGLVTQNTYLLEELASHGYIALSVAHTYETVVVVHPDGRAVPYDAARKETIRLEIEAVSETGLREQFNECDDPGEQAVLLKQALAQLPTITESIQIWSEDISFVVDELMRLDAERDSNVFEGRLDLDRVGVLGMSFGGTATTFAFLNDERLKAGVNLDGPVYGDFVDARHQRPFLHMQSEANEKNSDLVFLNALAETYRVTIAGTKHLSFSDVSIMAPIYGKQLGYLGPLDGHKVMHIVNDYVVAFFDKHLKGLDAPILAGPSPDYPEVKFESRNVPAGETRLAGSGLTRLFPPS